MIAYVIRRLLWLPILLVAVTLVTFALGIYGPGDPVQVLMGQYQNPEAVARIRHERGYDQPFPKQYLRYLQRTLRGDLGESIKYRGRPVSQLIKKRIWVSIQLNLVVVALGLLVGIPLGALAAVWQDSWLDKLVVSVVVGGISVPTFVIAPPLLYLLTRVVRLLPPGGWGGIFSAKIVLPAVVLASGPVAVLARQTRTGLIEVLGADYIRTARAKGLRELAVIMRHALPVALIPVLTIVGLMLGGLVEGSFITESIFGIPGIGRLGVEALFSRDYDVIMALTLIIAVSYILVNLFVDVGYHFLDPRIRYG